MTLSIIVPVYNAAIYLPECIESILSQTFRDFELILVDDGSTDNSGQICAEYERKDSRVRVVCQKNSGVSAARNKGIELSQGLYVAFVDADDTIEQNMYSELHANAIRYNADIVICGYHEFSKTSRDVLYSLPIEEIMDRHAVIHQLLYSDLLGQNIINSPCTKLYKKKIIHENGITFPKRRRGEDWLFNIWYLEKCNRAIYVNKPLYNYRRNETSAMANYMPEQYDLWKENRNVRRNLIKNYHFDIDWKILNEKWLQNLIPYIIQTIHHKDKNIRERAYGIMNDKEVQEACRYSNPIPSLRYEPIRKLLSIGWIKASYYFIYLFIHK